MCCFQGSFVCCQERSVVRLARTTGAEADSQETFQCVSAKHLNTSDCRTLTTKPVKRDGQSAGTCARTLYQSGPGPGVLRLQSPRPLWRTRRPRSPARA